MDTQGCKLATVHCAICKTHIEFEPHPTGFNVHIEDTHKNYFICSIACMLIFSRVLNLKNTNEKGYFLTDKVFEEQDVVSSNGDSKRR